MKIFRFESLKTVFFFSSRKTSTAFGVVFWNIGTSSQHFSGSCRPEAIVGALSKCTKLKGHQVFGSNHTLNRFLGQKVIESLENAMCWVKNFHTFIAGIFG